MALDLTGIDNVEFYSGHYLTAVLEGDLKSVFKEWSEAEKQSGTRPPHKALGALATPYFTARAQAEGLRDRAERWRLARGFHVELLDALGYEYQPGVEVVDGDTVVPVLLSLKRDGNPFLWVVDAPFPRDENEDSLAEMPLPEQLPTDHDGGSLPEATWREIFDEHLFRLDHSPRWVIFLCGSEATLVERSKWPQGRCLRFDLGELFGRKETAALKALAGLLHRDVLAPDTGVCLHDTLDENSHKHAFAVSGDLKHGVRRAVELIANEAVRYRREVQRKGVFNYDRDDEDFARALTNESLTYLYRLLFLFYVEARGAELDVVPMGTDAYREGYSLETLRDLELTPLTTEQARNGTYLSDSLWQLFRLVNLGFPDLSKLSDSLGFGGDFRSAMRIRGLHSPLFDDDRMPHLKGVEFRNCVLQKVLQLLSLSAEKHRKTRGRISYAQLGINQLGAVYEGLLSYTGFFATEDLYEVANAKENQKLSGRSAAERESLKTYFVPASRIGDYEETEIVRDDHGKKVIHRKGTFVFRLAGRNREKSASYYTPEVLTECLVKYALKELLEDEDGARRHTADEILGLTICEPAMGSGAFLNEAIEQLSDAYLEAKQDETGETIPPEQYQAERRLVKARLATNNCYGVDLNPVAVELAKVSLWLNTLHEGGKCPWFGLRLADGNSLVGARREVFHDHDITRKGTKAKPNWLGLVPEAVSLHDPERPVGEGGHGLPRRPAHTVYHFLLPASGMAAFEKDKVVKELEPEAAVRIKEWRKEFTKPFSNVDAKRLIDLSDAVDRLWTHVVRERLLATRETSDRIPVWPDAERLTTRDNDDRASRDERTTNLHVRDQEEVARRLESRSSAFRRLKFVMDYWCALWFWPIDQAALLPDRETWLAQLELVLSGRVQEKLVEVDLYSAQVAESAADYARVDDADPKADESEASDPGERLRLLRQVSQELQHERKDYFESCGVADVQAIVEADAGLRVAEQVAERVRFHHWELRFAEVFGERGGFDLTLGNPPWVLLSFDEAGVISDFDPIAAIRKLSATQVSKLRSDLLSATESGRAVFAREFEEQVGSQEYLGARQSYPLLVGMKSNSYKCFIERAWRSSSPVGVAAFLHPEGVYDDPRGGRLREELYPRLRHHYQFINEGHLFSDVHNLTKYSLNVYGVPRPSPAISNISNLIHPRTIDDSWRHDGFGEVPGIKDDDDNFSTVGHRSRLIEIDRARLEIFASLYDEPGTPALQARLPVVHAEEIVSVLERFAEQPRKLGDLDGEYFATQHWNETNSQKDGTIRRETRYPKDVSEWILQGPHFYVGTPFNKTPNEVCETNRAYTAIDLTAIDENYLPRTNYVPACDPATYRARTPQWRGKPVTEYYRHVHRRIVSPTGERTLVPAIMPPLSAHVHPAMSVTTERIDLLLLLNALCSSIPYDFLVKTTGKGDIYESTLGQLPIVESQQVDALCERVLRLNCVGASYAGLWESYFGVGRESTQLLYDRRLPNRVKIPAAWSRTAIARTDLERRALLVEVDVLASNSLGLSTEELVTIYRVQFPVLRQYERERLYDQVGRIVPASTTAAGNDAASLPKLAAMLTDKVGFDIHREYNPDDPELAELLAQRVKLTKRDAAVLGVEERCTMADLMAETEVRWYDDDHPDGRLVPLWGLRYADPGLEPRMERVYPTPWTRCDREADYRHAWRRLAGAVGKANAEC